MLNGNASEIILHVIVSMWALSMKRSGRDLHDNSHLRLLLSILITMRLGACDNSSGKEPCTSRQELNVDSSKFPSFHVFTHIPLGGTIRNAGAFVSWCLHSLPAYLQDSETSMLLMRTRRPYRKGIAVHANICDRCS